MQSADLLEKTLKLRKIEAEEEDEMVDGITNSVDMNLGKL